MVEVAEADNGGLEELLVPNDGVRLGIAALEE